MSEKMLGEVAAAAFYGYEMDYWPDSLAKSWQAAAEAIAAPLLARIAELEGEVEKREALFVAHSNDLGKIGYEQAKTSAAIVKGYEDVIANKIESAEAAYQRGVAEEMERWRNAAIAEKAKYGVDHAFNCGARTACDNILDVWRSASPAVDVTSDKGGER